MADNKKLFTAREAAQAVLAKAREILQDSSLMKAEKLKKDGQTLGGMIGYPGAPSTPAPAPMPKSEMKKYETENKKNPSIKYGKIEKDQKALERDFKEYEVKPGNSKDSSGPRLERQVSPSQNPKEEAEGNNKPDGMDPEYEFKGKVSKELAKEKASHMVKGENPDEKQDAQLGEKVEHDVEEHMQENAAAEQKEGHSMAKPGDKVEGQTESNVIPRLIASAKLSKFMEHMHSKRKNAQAQSPEAVGQASQAAPAPRSTQVGQPDVAGKIMGKK